jgi:hypothetical protein
MGDVAALHPARQRQACGEQRDMLGGGRPLASQGCRKGEAILLLFDLHFFLVSKKLGD